MARTLARLPALCWLAGLALLRLGTQADVIVPATDRPDTSLRHEIQHAIDRGLTWLIAHQDTNGWWSTPDHPAVTALVLSAFAGDPSNRQQTNHAAALARAYAYVAASAQPDGGIHRGSLANYNTAISMVALSQTGDPAYDDILRRARAFLIRSQNDFGEPGKLDTPLDGGVGYGDHTRHADLNNTLTALEALRATDHLTRDRGTRAGAELNWDAAIQFIQNCQNLPTHNRQAWVSDDPDDLGGFVYYPGHSMAGGRTNNVNGRVALRSYGSISYAGLLSYVYARLDRSDPRVKGVIDWLRLHYTLEENPGMGQQGLYYYFQLMTKALQAAGIDTLELNNGRRAEWRRELALRLLNLQSSDGIWSNPNNRWWENDPNLVTAYALISLEILWRGL